MDKRKQFEQQLSAAKHRFEAARRELQEAEAASDAWDCDCCDEVCGCPPTIVDPPPSFEDRCFLLEWLLLDLAEEIEELEAELSKLCVLVHREMESGMMRISV